MNSSKPLLTAISGTSISGKGERGAEPSEIIQYKFSTCASQFFQSALYLFCQDGNHPPSRMDLAVYDCDGELANSLTVIIPAGRGELVEISPLISGCKVRAGVQQAQVVVSAPANILVKEFLVVGEKALHPVTSRSVTDNQGCFFPLTFTEEITPIISIANTGLATLRLNFRLFLGQRTPEVSRDFPFQSSGIFAVGREFEDFIGKLEGKKARGYLRIRVRTQGSGQITFFEQHGGLEDSFAIRSIA